MSDEITFFPVGNGDMSLLKLRDSTHVLIDCYLQDEATENRPTVANDLIKALPRDEKGRPYVDVFLLTHPDEDHCKGAAQYLHLNDPDDYDDDADQRKVFVREMWSSPLIFRRRSKNHKLCDDASAIDTEARRRVKAFRQNSSWTNTSQMRPGDKIRLIGSDWKKDDGTDRLADLNGIRTKVTEKISWADDQNGPLIEAYIHGPLNPSEDENFEGNEEVLSKNNSSVIVQWKVFAAAPNSFQYNALLTGGDAEVEIWDRLWQANVNSPNLLEYDILLAPHHCSWGVLSSGAATDQDAEVNQNARSALRQKRQGATIVASSKPIKNDNDNPPADRAKRQYQDILAGNGSFKCLGEYPKEGDPKPLKFSMSRDGVKLESKAAPAGAAYIMTQTKPPKAG